MSFQELQNEVSEMGFSHLTFLMVFLTIKWKITFKYFKKSTKFSKPAFVNILCFRIKYVPCIIYTQYMFISGCNLNNSRFAQHAFTVS